jgi:predicted GH43/DUF377 family glycosyl hydrolase
VYGKTVSLAHALHLPWEYGEIRGGTNVVLIRDSFHLGFFHSSRNVENNYWTKTYFMGAYIFTKTEPFHLLSITPYPILNRQRNLYQGEFDFIHNRRIDYCIFPSSFHLVNNDTIYLTYGWNDHQGWLAHINLDELLSVMIPVGHYNHSL